MEAKIVLGLGFGDEGKGITTDFLSKTSPHPTTVIRFSGGHQAGHMVKIGDIKHSYSTFCSGTGRGLPSYLSEYCLFYPPAAAGEYKTIIEKGYRPHLMVNPLTKLTTYWDVAWGKLREKFYKHGSCGVGIGATMMRHDQSPYKLFVVDLKHEEILREKLHEIGRYYGEKLKELGLGESMNTYFHSQAAALEEQFTSSLGSDFIRHLIASGIKEYDELLHYSNFIFEGSQGILLDAEHGIFPNVTYSNTTSKNALALCEKMGISSKADIQIYYVTRCYLTRHGNGWLPSEKQPIVLTNNSDENNVKNYWQGEFKVRELDYELLRYALKVDVAYSWGYRKNLVVTCLDQRPDFAFDYSQLGKFSSIYESYSPDSSDFRCIKTAREVPLKLA